MIRRALIRRSAISGIIWAGIAIVVVMVLGGPGASLDRIAWAYRGGVLAAPFIGIAVGFSSGMFRRAGFAGRASVAIITLYVATFLFLLAARGFAFAAGEMRHVSLTNIIFDCWNATIAGLTWSGFVVVLAPLAYVTHLLVSRRDFFAPPQASAAR
jgi:hypothetical protein